MSAIALAVGDTHSPYEYSPSILPMMQTTLAALADIDCAHETRLASLASSGMPEVWIREIRASLEEEHRRRRAPYVHRLAALERRIGGRFDG